MRDHLLLSHGPVPQWPPVWTWIGGEVNKHPTGEVGILKEVKTDLQPSAPEKLGELSNRIFLFMEYREGVYMGTLWLSDPAFCRSLGTFLQSHLGKSLHEIGDLDLSPELSP